MSVSFASALAAAREAAGGQHYPEGTLYILATPIGNLADITLRGLHALQLADAVACEDTRHTQALLRAYGIDKPGAAWIAVHQHNESSAAEAVLDRLRRGERVLYASDAGTPAVSDPGGRLVAAVRAAGLRAVPLPGASSVTALLSVAGIAGDEPAFVFEGFLPAKGAERQQRLDALAAESRPVLLLEAPHRIEALARSLQPFGTRALTLGRELTKQFEEVETVTCETFAGWLAAVPQRTRGEYALVLHGAPVQATASEGRRILALLLPELPLKTAVRLAAEITRESRNELYDQALRMRNEGGGEGD